jgi:peptidoglycan/xylan/chitin deacetylase (PgdA/CDA1 family)
MNDDQRRSLPDDHPGSSKRRVYPLHEDTAHQGRPRPLYPVMAPTILLALITVAVIVIGRPVPPPVQIDPTPLVSGLITSGGTPAAENPTVEVAPTESPENPVSESTATTEAAAGTFPVSDESVPILMYHYIRSDPGPDDPVGQGLSVSPELFAEQLGYLAEQGYSTLTMAELADVWEGRRSLPSKPIVLTFDDGYRDFYTNAWPILQEYGFSATVYVFNAVIDQPDYLTRDMILELDASGKVDFGSHTIHHPDLPGLSDADAEEEIIGSKRALEELLGHPVRTFCYPHGNYTERDVALVNAAGYALAVTTEWGYAEPSLDPQLQPRIRIWGWTSTEELASWL